MEMGLDVGGWGKKSTAEQIYEGAQYAGDVLSNQSNTGIGGGAGSARGNAGNGVIINIGTVSKEVDVQHIGAIVSTELQKQNKRSHKF